MRVVNRPMKPKMGNAFTCYIFNLQIRAHHYFVLKKTEIVHSTSTE
jgi:hypothetical protein